MHTKQTLARRSGIASWLQVEQPRLGAGGLIVLLALSTLMSPLALDMYTPAVPSMVRIFSTTEGMVNLTLVLFYIANAVGLLLFGTISDKYGRKPVLLAGAVAYSTASFLSALSPAIAFLICMRFLQAMGAGAVSAVGTAIVKDAFAAEQREKVLSIVQIMFVVGPVCAPVLGAALLTAFSWRSVFLVLGAIGLVVLFFGLLYHETLAREERESDSVLKTVGHLGTLLGHRGFTLFLLVVCMLEIPYMAYIAVASYIYEELFGLSQMGYSLFFGFAALVCVAGPFIWLVSSKHVSPRRFTTIAIVVALAAGAGMLLFGATSPVVFCLLFAQFALSEAAVRPYSTNILLDQRPEDAGAGASLINFSHTFVGSVGMVVAVFPWPNYVVGLGAMIVGAMVAGLVLWAVIVKKPVEVTGLNG